jgi:hypothetical protein
MIYVSFKATDFELQLFDPPGAGEVSHAAACPGVLRFQGMHHY